MSEDGSGGVVYKKKVDGRSHVFAALTVPARIKTAGLKLGDSFLATAELHEDGTLARRLASDEGRKGAGDTKAAQGDLAR